jgi:hypothetical protein
LYFFEKHAWIAPRVSCYASNPGVSLLLASMIEIARHEAGTIKNLDLVLSLFADDAVLTAGGKTYTGKDQIQELLASGSNLPAAKPVGRVGLIGQLRGERAAAAITYIPRGHSRRPGSAISDGRHPFRVMPASARDRWPAVQNTREELKSSHWWTGQSRSISAVTVVRLGL